MIYKASRGLSMNFDLLDHPDCGRLHRSRVAPAAGAAVEANALCAEKYWSRPAKTSLRPLWTSRSKAATTAETSLPSTGWSCEYEWLQTIVPVLESCSSKSKATR